MIIILFRIVCVCLALVVKSAPSLGAEKLPINIVMTFTNYTNIDDFAGGRDALRAHLLPIISGYIIGKLNNIWTPTDQEVVNKLHINIESSAYDQSPYIELHFHKINHKILVYQGVQKVGVPAEGQSFAKRLDSVLKRAIRSNTELMLTISHRIHSSWDFGEIANLQIVRLMSDSAKRTFSPKLAELTLNNQPSGYVSTGKDGSIKQTLYLGKDGEVQGSLRPLRYDSVITNVAISARFCLKRQDLEFEQDDPARVSYECPIDGDCTTNTIAPKGWVVTQCPTKQGLLNRMRFDFTSSAFASERTALHWSVPPLELLYQRSPFATQANTGFTDFVIETDEPLRVKANAVALEVYSNGIPIWLNSIPPASNRVRIDPNDGLLLRFGIQNLQLTDRHDGCERLEARLVFYSDDEPTGDVVNLQRLYAPLRHPAKLTIDTPVGQVKWWGRYRQQTGSNESGIFLQSILFSPDKPGAKMAALEKLNNMRELFEAAKLRITAWNLGGKLGLVSKPEIKENARTTSLRLVGKIRPPRTIRKDGSIAYGLQLGLRAPNGLLQFTFDASQTRKLLDLLILTRKQDNTLKNLVPGQRKDFYVYTYTTKRQIGPEWACQLK